MNKSVEQSQPCYSGAISALLGLGISIWHVVWIQSQPHVDMGKVGFTSVDGSGLENAVAVIFNILVAGMYAQVFAPPFVSSVMCVYGVRCTIVRNDHLSLFHMAGIAAGIIAPLTHWGWILFWTIS